MPSKSQPRISQYKLSNRSIKKLLLIAITIAIVLLSWQLPSWGKAGMSEWQDRNPGDNYIGNLDGPGANGTYLSDGRKVYIDRIVRYRFPDGLVIGKTEASQYFLFDENTKKIDVFNTADSFCNAVNSRSNVFPPLRIITNNLDLIRFWLWCSFAFVSCYTLSVLRDWERFKLTLNSFDLKQAINNDKFLKSRYLTIVAPLLSLRC